MFRKILVPLDGSQLSERILKHVEEIADCLKAKITLITVGSAPLTAIAAESAANIKRESEKYLHNTADRLRAKGLEVSWSYLEGEISSEIVSYASKNQFELIAMATHGGGEIAWLLGSVAERVVSHSAVPVLLMRVAEFKLPLLKEENFLMP